MPTYDYECKTCHHRWEMFQSIMAEPDKKCPKCGKRQAQRVIGPGAGFIFKGSGFYQTDYRSSDYKKAAEADKKASDASNGDQIRVEARVEVGVEKVSIKDVRKRLNAAAFETAEPRRGISCLVLEGEP
jgi:putative FmdB family regulatory protein